MSANRLERDIKNLLGQHANGIVCSDIGAFRARLPSSGYTLKVVEDTLRSMRQRRAIRLKKVELGTHVRLLPSAA